MFLAGFALVSDAAAQISGIPIRNAGVTGGFGLAADVGFGSIKGPGDNDKSRAVGLTGAVGFGPLGLSGGLIRTSIDPAIGPNVSQTSLAAAAQFTVFGGPLVPLKITWQAGVIQPFDAPEGGSKPWRGHLGLGAALAIPAVAVSIRPWVAPRVDLIRVDGTQVKGAVSGGVDIGLLSGLGFRFAYDSRMGWTGEDRSASGFSVGVGFQFR
ncbi:MAG: hypothetical protein ACYC2K_15705 [Gemmatimonadales bacterium]